MAAVTDAIPASTGKHYTFHAILPARRRRNQVADLHLVRILHYKSPGLRLEQADWDKAALCDAQRAEHYEPGEGGRPEAATCRPCQVRYAELTGQGLTLRDHVRLHHPRMRPVPRSNEDLALTHATDHHRFATTHIHGPEANTGPAGRPEGWRTGGHVTMRGPSPRI